MTIAASFSDLPAGAETAAASLLVAGILLFDLGLIVNWLQRVEDAFEEASLGNKISTAGTPLVLVGTGIFLFGVLMAV
jgi:multisubunit Na+/H+ antiporter MnhG subunit